MSIQNYLLFFESIFKYRFISLSTIRILFYSLFTLFAINLLTKLIFTIGSSDQFQSYERSLQFPNSFGTLLLTVLIFPVYEEVAFRLFLDRKKVKVLISSALILSIFITYFILKVLYYEISNHFLWFMVLPVLLSFLIAGFMSIPFNKGPSFLSRIEEAMMQNYGIFYYWSAIAFSAFHIMFQTLYDSIPPTIVVVMFGNYFLAGLVFAHLRVTKGLRYSILLHAFMNLLVFLKGLG